MASMGRGTTWPLAEGGSGGDGAGRGSLHQVRYQYLLGGQVAVRGAPHCTFQCQLGHERRILVDGGQRHEAGVVPAGIVEADDTHLLGDVDACHEESLNDSEGEPIVEGRDRGWQGPTGQDRLGRADAVGLLKASWVTEDIETARALR